MIESTSCQNPSEERDRVVPMVLPRHRVALGFAVGHLFHGTA